MPVPQFPQRLTEEEVPLEAIMLDPNNPRLASVSFEQVPEERVAEEGIQRSTLRRLNEGRFDMDGLRASIRRSGLLPLDRIVIRPIEDDKYVVVEGNRRIGAMKSLLEQHRDGVVTLDDEVLATIERPRLLVLNEEGAEPARLDQWVIQGIRHITGIREWGGYQAARTIQTMIEDLDYDEREVVDALGISLQRVRRSMRILTALAQMQEDDEYGELAEPSLYAYFDEVIKRRFVRDWIGWDDTAYRFTNEDRARMFYSWITPDDELDGARRLPNADDVRRLDPILSSEPALAILNTPGQTINDAAAIVAAPLEPEWRAPVQRAIDALRSIPTSVLEDLQPEDRELIEAIRELAQLRLENAEALALARARHNGEPAAPTAAQPAATPAEPGAGVEPSGAPGEQVAGTPEETS